MSLFKGAFCKASQQQRVCDNGLANLGESARQQFSLQPGFALACQPLVCRWAHAQLLHEIALFSEHQRRGELQPAKGSSEDAVRGLSPRAPYSRFVTNVTSMLSILTCIGYEDVRHHDRGVPRRTRARESAARLVTCIVASSCTS
jgi:hypothetical protein